MKRVNFLLSGQTPRCYKRIREFINRGYEVKVYSFDRHTKKVVTDIPTLFIGDFPNTLPYLKRISIYLKALRKLFRENRDQKGVIWYYFGLSTCMYAYILNPNRRYIMEESDMSHMNIRFSIVRNLLERVNRFLIRRSVLSVFTSEGFVKFHFPEEKSRPGNIVVIPNKLDKAISGMKPLPKTQAKPGTLRFGFAGWIRYEAVYHMAECISQLYPQHEFHFFGQPDSDLNERMFSSLQGRTNVAFHGAFRNPDDLPKVYAEIDVVVSTYDTQLINVRYAEPNKLYESIYFRTPIIVSSGTFLEQQVDRYGSGWSVNPENEADVKALVERIARELVQRVAAMKEIPQDEAIDREDDLFQMLESSY